MSLSAKDRHALGSIQDQITGSDPQLASLMMFTRLASGEEMPALEDIRAGVRAGARGQLAPRAAERGQNTRHPSHRAPRSGARTCAPWARVSARCDTWTQPDTEREQNWATCVRSPHNQSRL
jgi:hypothetical protein